MAIADADPCIAVAVRSYGVVTAGVFAESSVFAGKLAVAQIAPGGITVGKLLVKSVLRNFGISQLQLERRGEGAKYGSRRKLNFHILL